LSCALDCCRRSGREPVQTQSDFVPGHVDPVDGHCVHGARDHIRPSRSNPQLVKSQGAKGSVGQQHAVNPVRLDIKLTEMDDVIGGAGASRQRLVKRVGIDPQIKLLHIRCGIAIASNDQPSNVLPKKSNISTSVVTGADKCADVVVPIASHDAEFAFVQA